VGDAVLLERVEKRFGAKRAVADLSLRVPAGCICGFLGPNGAGKTTTLRLIMGIFYPDAGRLEVLGQADAARVRERLGYLPEERGLYEKMRVIEMVAYLARLKGLGEREARQRARAWLCEFALEEYAEHRCESLSKGMSQKVQLLSTLIHEPELVILDEPFSGLDPVNRDVVRDLLLRVKREGRTVILSTHIMEQAEQLCDRVVLIDQGRKLVDGSLAEVRGSRGQAIALDYEGDGSCLAALPGIRRVRDAGQQAELFLAEGADPQAVLAALVGRLKVRRFDLREQSLHEIFVRAVKGEGDG
jgi:ABC-2 type transport system ATP-binding protein